MTTIRKTPDIRIPRKPGARPMSTAYTPDKRTGVFATNDEIQALRQRAIAAGRIVEPAEAPAVHVDDDGTLRLAEGLAACRPRHSGGAR